MKKIRFSTEKLPYPHPYVNYLKMLFIGNKKPPLHSVYNP